MAEFFCRLRTTTVQGLGEMKFLEMGFERDVDERPDADDDDPAYGRLCHATFQVVGEDLIPEDWSDYFDVDPTFSVRNGCRMFPHNPDSTIMATIGVWNLSTRDHVASDDLDPHVRKLLSVLRLPRPDFQDKLEACGLKAYIRVYWRNDTGDRIPSLSDPVSALLAGERIEVEIDEYPQTINVEDENGVIHQAWA
jgi:hypothetical protein